MASYGGEARSNFPLAETPQHREISATQESAIPLYLFLKKVVYEHASPPEPGSRAGLEGCGYKNCSFFMALAQVGLDLLFSVNPS